MTASSFIYDLDRLHGYLTLGSRCAASVLQINSPFVSLILPEKNYNGNLYFLRPSCGEMFYKVKNSSVIHLFGV